MFKPDYIVPPGETLQETIESLGLTQKELAQRMGRPLKTINEIIKGKSEITQETALQLEKVTGVPASFWNNSESNYREGLARKADEQRQQAEIGWLSYFSYKKMNELGFLPWIEDKTTRVDQLLRFFGVATPKQWESTYGGLCGAARESDKYETELGDLSVWLRAGELLAQKQDCKPYNSETFRSHLQKIRAFTDEDPVKAWPKVCDLCTQAGVAIVLVPELPKTHVSGFTRWLTPEKALIQLSLRHKTDDILWFTLFHEAAHILLHGKKDVFVEYRGVYNPKEKEANEWAANFLIPSSEWKTFIEGLPEQPSSDNILTFSKKQGIAPSVVLGRLQHREKRVSPSRLNHLKHQVEIEWKGLFRS